MKPGSPPAQQLYAGLMSGTSMDGVDAVLVRFAADSPSCLAAHTAPYPPDLRDTLLELCRPGATIDRMLELDVQLGELYADRIRQLLEHAGVPPAEVTAIGSHGQTIRHLPAGRQRTTLQIGDPNIIAQRTGITTVADLRRRDMAAGGQGAPLVPAFHEALFRRAGESRVIVNIGGMANITVLPGDSEQPVSGFDTGPGNVLLDGWAARHLGTPLDEGGAWAASGTVDQTLLTEMLRDPFLLRPPPKSTGREYFSQEWLRGFPRVATLAPMDVAATLCELTATSIMAGIRQQTLAPARIIVCGGGVHNRTLMERLAQLADPCPVESSAEHGTDPDLVEAMAFAWLARQTMNGRPGSVASVTGAREPVLLGGIYPG